MPNRDEIEKLAKRFIDASYEPASKGMWGIAEYVLANFVPRTEHERIVGELKQLVREGQPHSDELEEELEKFR